MFKTVSVQFQLFVAEALAHVLFGVHCHDYASAEVPVAGVVSANVPSLLLEVAFLSVSVHVFWPASVSLTVIVAETGRETLAPVVVVFGTDTVPLPVSVPVMAVGTVLDAAGANSIYVVVLTF